MSEFRTNSFVYRVSREEAIAYGHVKPTPEEVEHHNTESRVRWEKSVAEWEEADRFRSALADVTDPVARVVLDLHRPLDDDTAECDHCVRGEYGDHEPWPCDTVEAVSQALGIKPPDAWLGHRPGPEPHEMPPEGYTPIVPPLRRWITSALEDAIDSTVLHGDE